MAKQQSQQKIDLERIFNPNPRIIKAFKDADAMSLFVEKDIRSEFVNERRIFDVSNESKKPVKHKIQGIYRRKSSGGKEYIYFHEFLATADYWNNPVQWTRLVGKFDLPEIVQRYGLNPNSITNEQQKPTALPAEIQSVDTVYEFEFESIKNQLKEWYKKGIIDENTHFYVEVDGRKYGNKHLSFEQFISLPIEDLVLLANYSGKLTGVFNPNDPTMLEMLRKTVREQMLSGLALGPTPTPTQAPNIDR